MILTKENILFYIGKAYVDFIERIPFINWFNPLLTLYVNFRSFPFQQAIRLPLFVYGWPRLYSLYGKMKCKDKCKTGMITFNSTNPSAPSANYSSTAIDNWGTIIFHGKCWIHTSNKINVGIHGVLELGEGSKIMHFCNVTAYEYVCIGAYTYIAHRSQVMDTNFHYIVDFNKNHVKRFSAPIIIGSYCWICNSTTVSSGSVIPNKTIVASNSLVNKDMSDIPEESIIGGVPSKLISSNNSRIVNENFEIFVDQYFKRNTDARILELNPELPHSICDVDYKFDW